MISLIPDTLSPHARELLKNAARGGYGSLSSRESGDAAVATTLSALNPQTLLVRPATDVTAAQCAVAALWIWHGFVDQPHEMVQQVHSTIGSYWHGIIHRREQDYSNAKYWFARADPFPLNDTLAARADDLLRTLPADKSVFRVTANGWSPSAFVDLVASIIDQPNDPRIPLAVSLQQLEWQVLFDHCVRAAGA